MTVREWNSSFGRIEPELSGRGDRTAREFRNPFFEVPEHLWDLVPEAVGHEVWGWRRAVALEAGSLYRFLPVGAASQILTGASSDALALIDHLDRLDGRSAAHAARALFEHTVNLYDVHASAHNTAARYESHRFVTQDQVSKRDWYLQFLDKASRKRERDRLTRLGKKAAAPLASAIATYGSAFRRGWAADTLKVRADAHGLSAEYEGYRILSAVIHGSSGAMAGVVRQVKGQQVHRIGPDLDLAATAYAEGIAYFYAFADQLFLMTGRLEAEDLRGRTGNLLLHLQAVRETLRRIDSTLWPTEPPSGPVAVVALYRSGVRRWYQFDPRDDSMVLAEPPDEEPDVARFLKGLGGYDPAAYGGRPLTITFAGTHVTPRSGARPVPSASILIPHDHPSRLPQPRITRPADA